MSKEIETYNQTEQQFIVEIRRIVETARKNAYRAINIMQVVSNWLVGKRIVEQEQEGKVRADYGKHVIELASAALTEEYGSGYSETNIRNMRKFYLTFSTLEIQQTVPAELRKLVEQNQQTASAKSAGYTIPVYPQLSWSHYERLMRVVDESARLWYLKEAAQQMWAVRTLERNISTQYYERLMLSEEKEPVIREMQEKTHSFQQDKTAYIKNPVVAEFLGLQQYPSLQESTIEEAIITNMQKFLMELGKGYAFVARQQHIRTAENDYYIDLVFYNYILKCFVLVDLKADRLSYQDVGQMDMYLQMFDEMWKQPEDKPTIGIILCADTDGDVVRYSSLSKNEQLYATKYKLYLPTEEELRREIERQKEIYQIQHESK